MVHSERTCQLMTGCQKNLFMENTLATFHALLTLAFDALDRLW
jgi:hypothetical protein